MAEVECVLEIPALLGESPVWNEDEQALYWTDIAGQTLNRFDPATGDNEAVALDEQLCCFAFREAGGIIAAMNPGFATLDPKTGAFDYIHAPYADDPNTRLNDGRCDRAGRFFAGSMDLRMSETTGELLCLERDHSVRRITGGVIISNGLAWSPDDSIMYFASTFEPAIYQFDYDIETGAASNKRDFVRPAEGTGLPDGGCVDAEGYYWGACPMAGRITRYAPDGKVDGVIELPVRDPTMCAFGGPDLDTLYITTARVIMDESELPNYPLSGSLFACKPGVRGLPEPKYAG